DKQSADAQKQLEDLIRNTGDKKARDFAQKVLDDARKDRESNPGLPKDPPRDGTPGECKNGNGNETGASKGGSQEGAEGKGGGQGQAERGTARDGGQVRNGTPTDITQAQQHLPDKTEPSPGDPAHRRRPGALQLDDFTKIDKDILKDLKMSPEEWEAF